MDWFRRNWPDLLIGVALVAVIAMIVATLLSGGSLASLVRRDSPPELPLINTTGANTTGVTSTPAAGSNVGPAGTDTVASNTEALDTEASGTATSAATPDTANQDYDVFAPGVPGQNLEDGTGTEAAAPQNEAQSLADAPLQADGALPEASASGGYRVAAGATPSRDAASTLAQSYRDGGYEVTVEQQDDFYALWIGPYTTRADADSAAERIITDGGVALVHNYGGGEAVDNGSGVSTNAVSAQPGTGAPNTDAPDTDTLDTDTNEAAGVALADAGNLDGNSVEAANTRTETQTLEVSAGGVGERFLQVGAFASNESAEPLRAQLEGLGLDVTRNEDASGLVRLFVGPFGGGARLTQTQQLLSAEGIVGSFPVTR